jgi:hypothetical protein
LKWFIQEGGMVRRILAILLIAFGILNTSAYATDEFPFNNIKVVLDKYLNSIGCAGSVKAANVVKYREMFVAFFAMDLTCSDGNNNWEPGFAVLEYDDRHEIKVIPGKSFPAAQLIGFPQHVDKIYVSKTGELRYKGKEYNDGKDPICCPSIDIDSRFSLEKVGSEILRNEAKAKARYGTDSVYIDTWYWLDSRILSNQAVTPPQNKLPK